MSGEQYNAESVEEFFEGWLVRQEHYLDELNTVAQHSHESKDDDLKELISRILKHYEQYYDTKSRAAQRNVFLIFSPTWFTTFEKTLLWIGGFNPGLLPRIINCSVDDVSDEQKQRIKSLTDDLKLQERVLNDELAKIQERVAAPPLVGMLRRQGQYGLDSSTSEDTAIAAMRGALESVLASADLLRRNTALKVVEILTPAQTIKFLAGVTQLQLRIRASGLEKDAERRRYLSRRRAS